MSRGQCGVREAIVGSRVGVRAGGPLVTLTSVCALGAERWRVSAEHRVKWVIECADISTQWFFRRFITIRFMNQYCISILKTRWIHGIQVYRALCSAPSDCGDRMWVSEYVC